METLKISQERDTIPRVTHISYFQEVLRGIAEALTFEGLRIRVRQVSNEFSRRVGGGLATSRIDDSYTLWSPTADAIGELMRIGLVERNRPLPSKRIHVDAHRDAVYSLTPSGNAIVEQSRGNDSSFLAAITPLLIKQHPYLSSICSILAEEHLLIPEYIEEDLKEYKQSSPSWTEKLGEDAAARMQRSMTQTNISSGAVTGQIRSGLRKRFPPGAEPTTKDILDTISDALVVAALEARGFRCDAITFNTLMSWGRQLFIFDESRYVHGMPGRTIWSTAVIESADGEISISRRGLQGYGDSVADELALCYREIADAMTTDMGGPSVRYPYIEIFKIRALTAYRVSVNTSLVDRVIAEIADRGRPVSFRVELQLGTSNWPSSEAAFRLGSRRYYVILIKHEGDE